jgi:hypothetical protein
MALKPDLIVSGAIFVLVGPIHLFRLVYPWPIALGPHLVPFALSHAGCPVSAAYCLWAAWLLRATRTHASLPPSQRLQRAGARGTNASLTPGN